MYEQNKFCSANVRHPYGPGWNFSRLGNFSKYVHDGLSPQQACCGCGGGCTDSDSVVRRTMGKSCADIKARGYAEGGCHDLHKRNLSTVRLPCHLRTLTAVNLTREAACQACSCSCPPCFDRDDSAVRATGRTCKQFNDWIMPKATQALCANYSAMARMCGCSVGRTCRGLVETEATRAEVSNLASGFTRYPPQVLSATVTGTAATPKLHTASREEAMAISLKHATAADGAAGGLRIPSGSPVPRSPDDTWHVAGNGARPAATNIQQDGARAPSRPRPLPAAVQDEKTQAPDAPEVQPVQPPVTRPGSATLVLAEVPDGIQMD